jgi:hypothetical protein
MAERQRISLLGNFLSEVQLLRETTLVQTSTMIFNKLREDIFISAPCQESVQPPACMAILEAPSPAIGTVELGLIGRTPLFVILCYLCRAD